MPCKYYNPHMETILRYCRCLYGFKDCASGGPLHILLDDDNFDTNSINYCLEICQKFPEREGAKLGELICEEYSKLSLEERATMDALWNGYPVYDFDCDGEHCDNCPHGVLDELYWDIKELERGKS